MLFGEQMKNAETLIKIIWTDATGGSEDMCDRPAYGYITKTITYGTLYKEDDIAVVLMTSENDLDDVDYVAIPKGWILEKKEYGNKTRNYKRGK